MKAGDLVEVEIEGIGVLSNPIVDEVDLAKQVAV
jgi:2-keto-4-pentenoate hydratase/2-oxohepta-3-ene-1,7-dioic acid hydratase in catechol pathway